MADDEDNDNYEDDDDDDDDKKAIKTIILNPFFILGATFAFLNLIIYQNFTFYPG